MLTACVVLFTVVLGGTHIVILAANSELIRILNMMSLLAAVFNSIELWYGMSNCHRQIV